MLTKIIVTGNAGSGKTTVARRIGEVLNRKVVCLDSIVWKTGWKEANPEERKQAERRILSQEEWIVDGVSMTFCEAADLVVFLDYPRHVCIFRCIKRNWRYLFKSRPELPEGCPEIKIIWRLLQIIRKFPDTVRPMILDGCVSQKPNLRFVHIRRNEDLILFLRSFTRDPETGCQQGSVQTQCANTI